MPTLIYWMLRAPLFFTRRYRRRARQDFSRALSGGFPEKHSRPTVPRELAVAALSFGSHSLHTPSVKGVHENHELPATRYGQGTCNAQRRRVSQRRVVWHTI